MEFKAVAKLSLHELTILPSYAQYLLAHRLDEYVMEQLVLTRLIEPPLYQLLKDLPEARLLELAKQSSTELLSCLANHEARKFIDASVKTWLENRLPEIDKNDVAAEDIALVNYIRKRVLQHFVTDYVSGPDEIVELIREIDIFILEAERASSSAYIKLLQERVEAHSYLLQMASRTMPGAIYIVDVLSGKYIYANEKFQYIFGYDASELNKLYSSSGEQIIHQNDLGLVSKAAADLAASNDKDVISYAFRLLNKEGAYQWIRCYESVFKRTGSREVIQKIGIALSVDREQQTADELEKREAQLLQAQEIARLGSYSWDFGNRTFNASSKTLQILDLQEQEPESLMERIHPADRKKVEEALSQALQTGVYDCEFRFQAGGAEKIIWSKGVLTSENDKPIRLTGTIMDVTEQQSLVRKLQETEALYRQAESLAKLGSWTMNIKTGEFFWSDEMYNIYEVSKEGRKFNVIEWEEIVHPADRDLVRDHFNNVLETGSVYDLTHRILLKNGKEKIIHRRAEAVYDDNGQVVKLIGTTQDVTDLYKIQQELKENQTFIRKITDATPSIISSYNIHTGKYVFISEGLEKLLGYKTADAMREGVSFFVNITHSEDLPKIMQKNAVVLEEANANPLNNDLVAEFTYRMRHRNGDYRWYHTYGTVFDRNNDGMVEHVLNITLDVTEQVNASEKIKEQEHFIQQIADASPTILYLFDVATQSMAYINREIFFVLGYLPESILELGTAVTESLYHPEDWKLLPGRKQSGRNFQQIESMIQYECRLRNKDDEWKWFLVREIVFKTDAKGEISQILGAALDINRRKEMEKTILQNTMMLEQSNASLEEFAYVASHDLKEPLRKISTFGDRLKANMGSSMSPEGKMYLEKIVDASQRMQTMINDLLSISMISGNKSFETVSLQSLLDDALQTLEYKIEQQNALIRYDALPEAKVVPSQFRQLFQNLLSNSLKFVRPGVQPLIQIHHWRLSAQEVTNYQLARANQYLKIEFSDNGIGFENEFAGKIFAIFQRLHGRSEYEGSGIGLAICKKIVEHHGGVIYANGRPDEGATFTMIIPF